MLEGIVSHADLIKVQALKVVKIICLFFCFCFVLFSSCSNALHMIELNHYAVEEYVPLSDCSN